MVNFSYVSDHVASESQRLGKVQIWRPHPQESQPSRAGRPGEPTQSGSGDGGEKTNVVTQRLTGVHMARQGP